MIRRRCLTKKAFGKSRFPRFARRELPAYRAAVPRQNSPWTRRKGGRSAWEEVFCAVCAQKDGLLTVKELLPYDPAAAALLLALSGAANAERLIPGGQLVGVAVRSDGLVYVGATDLKKLPSPARLAGLKSGDIIRTVDGQTVSDTQSLGERLAAGKAVKLGVRRGERELTFDVQPQRDERDGVYRIGAWVREGAAGIGTLTYVDPETGVYGALGHPINDSDSGVSIPVREGVLYEGELTGVVRGRRGVPGALEGEIVEQAPLGTIEWNDDTGIGGVFVRAAAGSALFPDGIETESANRVKTGRGQVIATVDENGGVTIFAVNRDLTEDACLSVDLRAFKSFTRMKQTTLHHDDVNAVNTELAPNTVAPTQHPEAPFTGEIRLGRASWNVIQLY